MKEYLTLTDFVNDILKAAEKKISNETKMKAYVAEDFDKNRIQQPINQPLCGKEDCKCNKKEYTKPIIEKDDFFNSLTDVQREYCNFLIDTSYSNGYNQALIDNMEM